MPSIEGNHDSRRVLLPVAVFASRDPNDLTHEFYVGLLDTGATASWISRRVVDQFGLVSIGKKPVAVATEIRQRPAFVFRLGLRGDESPANGVPFVFAEIVGFMMDQASDFDVLLGMDVLRETDFSMRRDGAWKLSFGA